VLDSAVRTFLRQWTRHPGQIGAVAPSGRLLAGAMAKELGRLGNGTVIELGAGTGTVTRALLAAGVHRDRLLIIERNPQMAEYLRRRFPGARVVEGDAFRLKDVVPEKERGRVAAIVSGLPLLLIREAKRYALLKQAFELLGDGRPFVQFTYGPLSPVPRPVLRRLHLSATRVDLVWRNLPPATVWRFHRLPPLALHAPARTRRPRSSGVPVDRVEVRVLRVLARRFLRQLRADLRRRRGSLGRAVRRRYQRNTLRMLE
jgi:phosphatidylethanolamine/phosphatidyl-N-methylethanolamine N-methyltransferase